MVASWLKSKDLHSDPNVEPMWDRLHESFRRLARRSFGTVDLDGSPYAESDWRCALAGSSLEWGAIHIGNKMDLEASYM